MAATNHAETTAASQGPVGSVLPLLFLLLAVALLVAPASADDDWKVYWKNGTRVESADGQFELKFGGRIQADFTTSSGDDAIDQRFDLEDGTEFRRARLFFEGTLYERFEFKIEYDFAGGDASMKDVYVGINDLPYVGGIQIGHMKEPFGLEQQTSSKYMTFLERSFTDDALNEGRNTGILLHNAPRGERITWAAGAFRPSDDSGRSLDDQWNLTARVTGLPVYRDAGAKLFHLGLSLSDRSPVNDQLRFRTRPEVHLAPRFLDTGTFASDRATVISLELATVQGRFWAASEITQASVSVPTGPDPEISGFNVQAGYFLTGEHRPYKKSGAAWDRVKPSRDFKKGDGIGAWELAARYTTLDANDQVITGGALDGVTFALNWYPNSAFRAMLNLVRADLQDVGKANFVLVRFAVDF